MEYSLLPSKWHCPSLGITMPAILLSIPKCESSSLTNTSKRMESFLQPILSCQETEDWSLNLETVSSEINQTNDYEVKIGKKHEIAPLFIIFIIYLTVSLTPQTAACIMASKPHSGRSILADTRCFAIISLNLSVLLVSDKTCLYPKVGRQVKSGAIPLKNNRSQKQWRHCKCLSLWHIVDRKKWWSGFV